MSASPAVRAMGDSSNENDLWSEHDLGAIDLDGEKTSFKLDYYDLSLQQGSENSANEGRPQLVLSITLAMEY